MNDAPLQFNCNVCGMNLCFPHTQGHACEAIVEPGMAAARRVTIGGVSSVVELPAVAPAQRERARREQGAALAAARAEVAALGGRRRAVAAAMAEADA